MVRQNSINNKRIARNTVMLYFRMILIMAVTLYTTRIILKVLGVEDFGIYNVVGGIVTMLGFLSSSMSSAVQRFLSFELGNGNLVQLNRVFGMSVNIQFIIALAVLVIAETIGLWFVNTQLTIPNDRLAAANFVYQFSILTFIVSVLSVPYNAAILTYEKMDVFAYISILEVALKLAAVFILQWFGMDKLILYSILIFSISLIIGIIYGLYVDRVIPTCKYFYFWDRDLFKTLTSFAAWNLWGNVAVVTYNQGINILLNIFFGPIVNAARAVAYQVNGALSSFIINFQTALRPPIMKSYGANEKEYMHFLIISGSKYSYYLMLLLCIPFLINTRNILELWLGNVPDYTVIFCRLVLIDSIINSLSGTLMTGAQATGKIKVYQGVVGGLLLLILPLSYVFLSLGFVPETTLIINITISVIALFTRLWIIAPLVDMAITRFLSEVISPVSLITLIVSVLIALVSYVSMENWILIILYNSAVVLISCLAVFAFGLGKSERDQVRTVILKISGKVALR